MKKIFLLLLYFYTFDLLGQTQLTGVVQDTLNHPVSFATIGVFSVRDSNLVRGSLAGEDGKYNVTNIPAGNYYMKVSAFGYYEVYVSDILIDSVSRTITNNIHLSYRSDTLETVSVVAVKKVVVFENGNIIINVEDSPLSKGNTAYDLLMKMPGVSIDGNKIMLQGKTGVIVMIDGRAQTLSGDQLINLLKSMNADLISTINILKNPPAQYDAAGSSGIIDIKSKKVKTSGLTGSVFDSYAQGFYYQTLPGFSLNYKTDKFLFYSSVTAAYGFRKVNEHLNRNFHSDTSSYNMNTSGTIKALESSLNYRAGLDWQITEKDILGVQADGGPGKNEMNTNSRNDITDPAVLGFSYLNNAINQPDIWSSNNVDLNYTHIMDTLGSVLSVVGDYMKLDQTLSNTNRTMYYDDAGNEILSPLHFRGKNVSNSDIISGRLDLIKVIDSLSSLEAGVKVANSNTNNDYLFERDTLNNDLFYNDTSISNKFKYKETTYAGYFTYARAFDNWSMRLGARVENTSLTGRNDRNFVLTRKYFNVFPNISIDYSKSEKHNFQLSLSRRIDRPNFADLNPFKEYHDQYSLRQGNPFMLPDYTNRGELIYTYNGMLSLAAGYSYTQRVMMEYTSQNDSTRIMFQSVKNMKSSQSVEFSFFYNNSFFDKWDFMLNGTVADINYVGEVDGVDFVNQGITYYGNINNIFLISENVKLEAGVIYWGPRVYGINLIQSRWMANAAVNVSLCKSRLDLTFGVNDIFHTFRIKSETNFENQNWSYLMRSDTRRFRIALVFNFGKIRVEEREVEISNEDEKDRFNH